MAAPVPELSVSAASRRRIAAIVSALAAQAETRMTRTPAAACQELEELLRNVGPRPLPDPAEAAARAGMGRLLSEDRRWLDAAGDYAWLRNSGSLFPEADVGLNNVLERIRSGAGDPSGDNPASRLARLREALDVASRFGTGDQLYRDHRELGEALWRQGVGAEAAPHFSAALLASGATPSDQAAAHAALGLVQVLMGQTDAARASFLAALRSPAVPGDDPGEALADACRPLLRSVSDFWTLDEDWEACARDAAFDEATRAAFAGCRIQQPAPRALTFRFR